MFENGIKLLWHFYLEEGGIEEDLQANFDLQ